MLGATEIRDFDASLARFGVTGFDWTTAGAANGRNDNWLGDAADGRRVFIKRLAGSDLDIEHGLRRTEAFYRTRATAPTVVPRTVELLGQDERTGLQIFDGVHNARDGLQLAEDDLFGTALGAEAGAMLGSLHKATPTTLLTLEETLGTPDPSNPFQGLTADTFYDASGAHLGAWRLLQRDPLIVDAFSALYGNNSGHPRVPCHGDVRLDQFLVDGDTLYLVDWKAFQLSEPARDLDAFVVYLAEPDAAAAELVAAATCGLPGIGGETSVLAERIGPGIATVWEPAETRFGLSGLSFGQHRCRVLARALLTSAATGKPRAPTIVDAFLAARIDPGNPALNTDRSS